MTKKELSQLYWLNREIEEQQRRLEELECLATSCTSNITGMPKSRGVTDKLSKYAAEIVDLRGLIDLNIKKCFYELNRLNRYIETVEDSQMRMILSLRYINGLIWQQIAMSIGGGNTADSVRKAHDRFLAKK
ncbi:MAG: RNA polymerase subunit sigma-24 [Candidatus Metalachnospira sp.]|nr:RNA polymerase subunit sigma-24 [Candidatus Metalachnospira sp.]